MALEVSMKLPSLVMALALSIAAVAWAVPRPGRALPAVSVTDLAGTRHTERDLTGQWTVAFAMTDKDVGANVTAWWRQIEGRVPPSTRLLTFVALDLFVLVPTATVVSQAREATPRSRWHTVWFSRDGSFADQLGLPESEIPWVFVLDPSGRVVESLHADVDAEGVARVVAAITAARSANAAP